MTYTIHDQAKYQRLNANTLYVAAILFSRSTLHREAPPCLPNTMNNNNCANYLIFTVQQLFNKNNSKVKVVKPLLQTYFKKVYFANVFIDSYNAGTCVPLVHTI